MLGSEILNERKRPVGLVEAGLLTALAVIFTIAGTYIPFLGFMLTIVAVPLALIGIRHGLRILWVSIVAASLIGIMIGGISTGVSVGIVAGGTSAFIAYCFQHKWQVSRMVIGVSILSILTLAISFQVAILVAGIDFFSLLDTSMQQSVEMMKGFMTQQGQYEEYTETMELSIETLKMVFPTMLFLFGVIHAAINIVVLRAVMKRLRMPFLPSKPFNEFTFDKSVLIGTSLIMILSYLAGVLDIVDLVTLFLNVILIIVFTFSIQGMAVIDYFFASRGVGQGMRVFVIALLYIVFNGYIFLGILGWFDIVFNFRKLERADH